MAGPSINLNPILMLALKEAANYLESHPQEVQILVSQLVAAAIAEATTALEALKAPATPPA